MKVRLTMLKLINIENLVFEPALPVDVREALGSLNFLDHLESILELDSDAIIETVERLYGIELEEVEGDPVFMPSADLIASIKDGVLEELTGRGVIGDAITEKIHELTRVSGDNIDAIYSETGLSRWKVEWD
jgi:hypothetical protein